MSDLASTSSVSTSFGGPNFAVSYKGPQVPSQVATPTMGSYVALFGSIKKYLSDKPLRIRTADGQPLNDVRKLADQWVNERPRGCDIQEMIDTPAYRRIVQMGHRAIRPLLIILQDKPDHWFPALSAITGENPVSPESEGQLKAMAEAWLKWGKERGYISDLD